MQKLILRNSLSPGDIVMLTAAVRDLHRSYPGQFLTDVRTSCTDLWLNNPHITPLSDTDPEVTVVDCAYPLINRSNEAPYHCLHGFIEFLNERLDLNIKPSLFKGDIHLSVEEKAWASQVHEITGADTPFWIVAAGGKYDITIKWWDSRRYQTVVDHFRGKIQFVQVGAAGHYHPKLRGVIDLRGQTSLRELIRLVYHAQGILCGVTVLMHLAAAVEFKFEATRNRPCVVVAGGREPAHWEAYPDHQFIATTGSLRCCSNGGCWKARTRLLGDGDERDRSDCLCVDVTHGLPRCMDVISAKDVTRRIQLYFDGGVLNYLAPEQYHISRRGISATRKNSYDNVPLTLQNARQAFRRFADSIPTYPGGYAGRGIVICAGGVKYFTNAWVCINMLRKIGCSLPIQIWHLGEAEMDDEMRALVRGLGVECVDALTVARRFPVRRLGGWGLKPYAILRCPFREVLFLDADNVPVVNPEFLFDTPHYRETGAIFWPDYGRFEKTQAIWDNCGLLRPEGPEFESGQIVVDKERCWKALCLALWFNENSDFYYQHLHGDKETFHLAFHQFKKSYAMVPVPIHPLAGTMCQHDFGGRRIFQHRNTDKWNLFLRNKAIDDFWFGEECRDFVRQLQSIWDGRASRYRRPERAKTSRTTRKPVAITACLISCPQREALRAQTLRNLAATDWGEEPVWVQIDAGRFTSAQERQTETALRALENSLNYRTDYILFLEDDLVFNQNLRHNLERWTPLQNREITLGGLYNPHLPELACDPKEHYAIVAPTAVYGSQAFIISRPAVKYLVNHWNEVEGMQDIKMSRLSGRLRAPLFYHDPSLVEHIGAESLWGGVFHRAWNFDPLFKA